MTLGNLDEVIGRGIAGITVGDKLKSWLLPVNVNGRHVDTPNDDALVVGRDLLNANVDVKILGLIDEVGTGNGVGHPRDEGRLILADRWCSISGSSWVTARGTRIGEDSATEVVVGTGTILSDLGAEPVVADCLVCRYDNLVALADGEEDPLSGNWFDGDEVTSNDCHIVVIERHTDVVVNGCVDQAEKVLLALRNGVFAVTTSTFSGLGSTVHNDVVSWWRWRSSLEVGIGNGFHLERSLIVPIRDLKWTEIDIVVGGSRAVNDNGTSETIAVLRAEM